MTRQFGGVEPGSTMPLPPTKPRKSAVAYLYADPVGRLALVAIAFATLGLASHFWAPDEFLCCAPCWGVLPFGIRHAVLTTKHRLILHPDRLAALGRVTDFFRARGAA